MYYLATSIDDCLKLVVKLYIIECFIVFQRGRRELYNGGTADRPSPTATEIESLQ